jgi:N-acetylgalactosamine kinase
MEEGVRAMAKKGLEEERVSAVAAFRHAFPGETPTHLSRAPGRVNLIGEHTDYNGLPVFPMALLREVRIPFRPREDAVVRFANPDPEFPPRAFALSREIEKEEPGDWGNYLKAPCQALVRRLGPLRGMDAFLTSSVPVASGLSSSSAVVIAVGRAVLHANGAQVPTLDLAEEMARAERYTGTQGGGMDQAISLGAVEGHASRIEFSPLRMYQTPVPTGWRFVVGHTLVRAEKSGQAQAAYNRRRTECGEALEGIAAVLGVPGPQRGAHGESDPARTGGAAGSEILTYSRLLAAHGMDDLLALATRHLPSPLLQRFRHVVTEAGRVYGAEAAMREADILTFGALMDASHESLREDYEVSSPELDRLVGLAREAGAAGARLTGAGFGGCMVALAEEARVRDVLRSMEEGYYRARGYRGPLSEVLFLAEPSGGASVLAL